MVAVMEFSNPTIQEAFLLNASPEFVYAWIKEKAGESTEYYHDPFPEGLISKLKDRNELLINLAIAEFTADSEILKELFNAHNKALRVAVLANQYRDADVFDQLSWITEAQFKELCTGPEEEIAAYFSNRRLRAEALANVYLRKGLYAELSDAQWQLIIAYAVENPDVTEPHEEERFSVDGWSEYEKNLPWQAVWTLLDTLPNTVANAAFLSRAYERIEFTLPTGVLKSENEQAPKEPQTNVPESAEEDTVWKETREFAKRVDNATIKWLSRLFNKWLGSNSKDPHAFDSKKEESFYFRVLRETISYQVTSAEHGSVLDFLRNHSDTYVRRGFYRGFEPDEVEELDKCFAKDGKHFLEAAVENETLYRKEPAAIRSRLYHLVWWEAKECKDLDFEDRQMLRSSFDGIANALSSKDPNVYLYDEYEVAFPSDEDDSTVPSLNSMYEKVSEIMDQVGSAQDKSVELSKILRTISKMQVVLGDQMADEQRQRIETSTGIARKLHRHGNTLALIVIGIFFLVVLLLFK